MFTREVAVGAVGEWVLRDLVNSYKENKPYYLSNTINYMFDNEDDALFTTNEEILVYVRKILADEYDLEIAEVTRSYADLSLFVNPEMSEKKQEEMEKLDFTYQDIEIKIKKK